MANRPTRARWLRIGSSAFLGVLVASIALTMTSRLETLDATHSGWEMPMLVGNLLPMLLSTHFWSGFPVFAVGGAVFFAPLAWLVELLIVAICTLLLRRHARCSWSTVGFAIATLSLAPMVAGSFEVLRGLDAIELGSWLTLMVATAMYGGLICAACALLDVVAPDLHEGRQIRRRVAPA